jgi:hypothetical protein
MAEPLGRHLRPARRSGLTSPEPVRTPDGPRGHPDPAPSQEPWTSRTAGERQDAPGISSRNSSCRNQAGKGLPELAGGSRLSTLSYCLSSLQYLTEGYLF